MHNSIALLVIVAPLRCFSHRAKSDLAQAGRPAEFQETRPECYLRASGRA